MLASASIQPGKELAWSDHASLFTGSAPGSVIKIWRTFSEAEAEGILRAVQGQQSCAGSGCRGVLPVLSCGLDETGAPYAVMPACPLSVRKLIEAQNAISSSLLQAIVLGTVEALQELAQAGRRSHGNLSPGNILLTRPDPTERGFAVALSDLATPGLGTVQEDLFTLGRVIYQMVRRTERVPQHLNPPLNRTTEWDYLGSEAEGWLEVCNALLSAETGQGTQPLDRAAEQVRRRARAAAGLRRRRELRRTVLIGGAAVLLLGLPFVVARLLPHGPDLDREGRLSPAAYSSLVAMEKNDETLRRKLSRIQREADGAVTLGALEAAFTEWVTDGLQSTEAVLTTQAVESLREQLTGGIVAALGSGKFRERLEPQLAAARDVFRRCHGLVKQRQEVEKAASSILQRPESEVVQFVDSWKLVQLAPAPNMDEAKARLDRAQRDLPEMADFLRQVWPNVRQEDFRIAFVAAPPSGAGALQEWMAMARRFVALATPVAKAGPGRDSGTPATGGTPEAPSPVAAARARLKAYAGELQNRVAAANFSLAEANQQRQRFNTLRGSELAPVSSDLGMVALEKAFASLPEREPTLRIPALEERGWTPGRAGVDWAEYAQSNGLKVAFHRVGQGASAFGLSAIEIPLQVAVNSRAWTASAPPDGPQVWMNAGGRIQPAQSWLWPAVRQAKAWLSARPDMSGATDLYPGSTSAPAWNTPVTGLNGTQAAAICKALGGSLPTLSQWRAGLMLANQNRWIDTSRLAGPALAAQVRTVAEVEARLKASSWRRSFFDVPGVGNNIWPDTGSYAPSRTHQAAAGGTSTEPWFAPADREALAAPERIYHMVGNVAELVDAENGGFAVLGGSAISSDDWRNPHGAAPNSAFSDVGFRMAVPIGSGAGDPLASFREAVRSVPTL